MSTTTYTVNNGDGPIEVTESDPSYTTVPKFYPASIKSMKLRVTTGTSPNAVVIGEQVIENASWGTNNVEITDENLINAFNNQTLGTTYNFNMITNYTPGSFPSGDVVSSPSALNQTVKRIPEITIFSYTYSYVTSDGYVSQTVSSNSNATSSYSSSVPSVLSIDPATNKYIINGEGTAVVTITQPSNSIYESVTTQETVEVVGSTVTIVPLVLHTNGLTIVYTGSPTVITQPIPLFIQANLRGNGSEWFAVVNQSMWQAIRNYAIGTDTTTFRPPGQSSPVPFNNIVTTLMTDTSQMFFFATSFNQPLNSWDVSGVINMSNMFASASTFNQPLNSWNTSRVINMSNMFAGASTFNQPLNSWNVSNAVVMFRMFQDAIQFNQNISGWNVNRVIFASGFRLGNTVLNTNHLPSFRVSLSQ